MPTWRISFSFTVLAIVAAAATAFGSEREILEAVANGSIKLQTAVAVPSGAQSPEPPGWQNEPANFIYKITKAEEKAITDKAYPLLLAKWPFNSVSVCWENPDPENQMERGWVQDAVFASWRDHSALQFPGWERCASNNLGVRILIKDTGPYAKYLGKYLNGEKEGVVLNFTFHTWGQSCNADKEHRRSCIESIAVHEFGHAIGFAHEQNRPDTPGECTERPQGQSGDDISITPWDPHSVMNYCNSVYNNNGILSEFDVKAVQYIYGPRK
jgi:Astacin (Peptidase family M12A)